MQTKIPYGYVAKIHSGPTPEKFLPFIDTRLLDPAGVSSDFGQFESAKAVEFGRSDHRIAGLIDLS